MSTRFKNTSGAIWAELTTTGKKWVFDTYGIEPVPIEATLEELTGEFNSYGDLNNTGDIVASLEALTADCTGTNEEVIVGDIDCTLDDLECVCTGSLKEKWVDCQLEHLICEGWGNMGLECTIEYMSCTMDSMFGATIEGSMQELDIYGTIRHCKADLIPLLRRLNCEMYVGSKMYIEFQKPTMSGIGFQNIEGGIQTAFQTMTFEANAGAYIVTEFESIGFVGQASVPILGDLKIQTRSLQCTMQATTESVDVLIATIRRLQMVGAATTSATVGTGGDLIATMRNMNAVITGINGQVCDLEASLPRLLTELIVINDDVNIVAELRAMTAEFEVNEISLEASLTPLTMEASSQYDHLTTSLQPLSGIFTGYITSINTLETELQELTANMISFSVIPPDGETCEPYQTLRYEEVV